MTQADWTAKDRLARLRDDITVALDKALGRFDAEGAERAAETARIAAGHEQALDRIKELLIELETASRHRELYRLALYTYLQERDGPAGTNAPTPETLQRIRELLEGV